MDCKVDRKLGCLHINHLALEPSLKKRDEFAQALMKELREFKDFNDCTSLVIHRTTPVSFVQFLDAPGDFTSSPK